jgi:DNA-binding NarL/FixJ family response regulator
MNRTQRARVLIADFHTLVAQAYKSVLEPEFEVVGIVNDGRALLTAAAELKPDVIILEIALPLLNGLDAGEQMKEKLPATHLVYVSTSAQPETAAEAFRRGASAYLSKAAAVQELVAATREVRRGVSYLSPLITKGTIQFLLHRDKVIEIDKHLTLRQREILQLLAEGMSMKEVAYTLNLKPGTIAFHKYRIMSILGVKTNTELLQHAIKQHLIAA